MYITFFPLRGELFLILAEVCTLSSALEFKGVIFKKALLQLLGGSMVLQTHFLMTVSYARMLNLMQI